MIFISYKSEEYHIARRIRLLLEANHYSCWMAPESIAAGSNYMAEIPKAIRSCDIFILVVSKSSQNSQWVLKELDRAVNFNKYILPFQVDNSALTDAVEFVISNTQRIDAYQNFEAACRKLLETVRTRYIEMGAMESMFEPTTFTIPEVSVSVPAPSVPDVSTPALEPTPAITPITTPTLEIPDLPTSTEQTQLSVPKMPNPAAAMPKTGLTMPKPTSFAGKKTLKGAPTAIGQKQNVAAPVEEKPAAKAPVRQMSMQEMRETYERNFEQNNPKGFKVNASGELTDYKSNRKEEGIVVVPFGVREIAGSVFAKCRSMHCVVLPPTLETIGTNAFLECTNLDKVILHDGLVRIDAGAFQGCNLLKTMKMPQTLKYIGAYAFFGCTKASLSVLSDVEQIGAAAFNQCANVTLDVQNGRYAVNAGCIVDLKERSIVSAIADAILPATIDAKEIGDYAFDGNSAITRVSFPSGVTRIGMGAFRGCVNVTEVYLGASVKTIEAQAFMGCSSLQSLTMEPGVETIDNQAFAQCKSLKSVAIPVSVHTRAKSAFEGCPRIKISE